MGLLRSVGNWCGDGEGLGSGLESGLGLESEFELRSKGFKSSTGAFGKFTCIYLVLGKKWSDGVDGIGTEQAWSEEGETRNIRT